MHKFSVRYSALTRRSSGDHDGLKPDNPDQEPHTLPQCHWLHLLLINIKNQFFTPLQTMKFEILAAEDMN